MNIISVVQTIHSLQEFPTFPTTGGWRDDDVRLAVNEYKIFKSLDCVIYKNHLI